jgi:hypothetical protein
MRSILLWLCLPVALQAQFEHAQPLVPPPPYSAWWAEVAASCDCTPATTLSAIAWYVVPGETFTYRGMQSAAAWDEDNLIVLARRWRDSKAVVQHEMLHAILGGDPQHRHAAWLRYFRTPATGL